MKSIPFVCIFVTLALLPSFARPESTSIDLDEVLRNLEQLETSQKRQVQQMQNGNWIKCIGKLNSARAELNLMKRPAVQSKNVSLQSFAFGDHNNCCNIYTKTFHLILFQDTTMYSFSVRLEGNKELDDGPLHIPMLSTLILINVLQ